jgi:phage-related minor tail protein
MKTMEEFEQDLAEAGQALAALADGPGRAAADALGSAFDQAGTRIEQALGRAARTGELDFSRMAESILQDFARIAAEALVSGIFSGGQSGPSQTVNMNFNMGAGANAGSVISRALAQTAAAGGRFI